MTTSEAPAPSCATISYVEIGMFGEARGALLRLAATSSTSTEDMTSNQFGDAWGSHDTAKGENTKRVKKGNTQKETHRKAKAKEGATPRPPRTAKAFKCPCPGRAANQPPMLRVNNSNSSLGSRSNGAAPARRFLRQGRPSHIVNEWYRR